VGDKPIADYRAGVADGNSSGPATLVFVHGAMDRATSFERVRRRLKEFNTSAYDRRGYASSAALVFGEDAFADHVADLRSVLERVSSLHPPEVPIVLVGHSAGSNIVMAVTAAGHPAVRGAVVYEPPMPWATWWPGNAGGSTMAVYEAEGPAAAAESFMRRIVGDRVWEILPAETKEARRIEGEGLIADLMTLRGRPVQFDHRAIRVPVVVGRGEKSLEHQRRSSAETASLVPGSQLIDLLGQGHGAHGADPEGFSGLIHRILNILGVEPPVR
jgi:pimeloyl-ACP methyl ester carboxylesterase